VPLFDPHDHPIVDEDLRDVIRSQHRQKPSIEMIEVIQKPVGFGSRLDHDGALDRLAVAHDDSRIGHAKRQRSLGMRILRELHLVFGEQDEISVRLEREEGVGLVQQLARVLRTRMVARDGLEEDGAQHLLPGDERELEGVLDFLDAEFAHGWKCCSRA
jgi:hypothetical protein